MESVRVGCLDNNQNLSQISLSWLYGCGGELITVPESLRLLSDFV